MHRSISSPSHTPTPVRRGRLVRVLPPPLLAAVMFCLLVLNTLFWVVPVYLSIALKMLSPSDALRQRASALVAGLAQRWALVNVALGDVLLGIRWEVHLPRLPLSPRGQYLIAANHQSWNDIYTLVRIFGRKTPFFKFFLKQQLLWVPVLGPVWWGLDYPFMKRYSRQQIEQNPKLKGRDLETTRRACARYGGQPVAILNFLEGTRFTPAKRLAQRSPYRHLLRPKAGGLAFTLVAMGDRLSNLLDVTIVYPQGARSLYAFLAGRVRHVIVDVRALKIPPEFARGDYVGDPVFRRRVQAWVGQIWAEKDQRIEELLHGGECAGAGGASSN